MRKREIDDAAVDIMKRWCFTILDFVMSKDPEDGRALSVFKNFRDGIDRMNVSNKMMFKALVAARSELNTMTAEGLSKLDLTSLNEILFEKFGENLTDEFKKKQKIIQSIIKKDKIINDDQFYLINNILIDVSNPHNYTPVELAKFGSLILEYEEEVRKKRMV